MSKKYVDKVTKKVFKKENELLEQQQQQQQTPKEDEKSPLDMFSNMFSPPEDKEDKDKIIEILFEHKDLRKIADITPNEIIDMTVLSTFAKDMNVPLIDYFLESKLALSLSKNRKSREEIVEIYKTQTYGEMGGMFPDVEQQSRFSRLKERFGV